MFTDAKLKLTVWYVLVISSVSLIFSIFIYSNTVMSTRRALLFQQERMEQRKELLDKIFPPSTGIVDNRQPRNPMFEENTLLEIHSDLKNTLIKINLAIIVGSAALGYFLAGKTLKPIEKVLNSQKQFISDAAHELKTPVTALKTEIEVSLRDKKIQNRELLQSNLDEVNKLQNLTEDLLAENYYQGINSKLEKSVINLREVLEKSISSINKQASVKNIKLISNLADLQIKANERSIGELATVLLDNAVKYSKENSEIDIKLIQRGKNAVITVTDSGVGIEKSQLEHIFERFYRADKSRSKNEYKGFGLGLSIAKNIVELHRGCIKAESTINKGSTFTVILPLS